MKYSRNRTIALLACLMTAFSMTGCYSITDGAVSVRRDIVNVGRAQVGDTVSATFRFRNSSQGSIELTFMPECDCTKVVPESMLLAPRERGTLSVRVGLDMPGEFCKYVYVTAAGSDGFLPLSVNGVAD